MSDQVITPSFYRALTSTRGLHNLIVSLLADSGMIAADFPSLSTGWNVARFNALAWIHRWSRESYSSS